MDKVRSSSCVVDIGRIWRRIVGICDCTLPAYSLYHSMAKHVIGACDRYPELVT